MKKALFLLFLCINLMAYAQNSPQFPTPADVSIHVRNRGLIWQGVNEHGQDTYYFRAAPTFEAPADSQYAWLNNALFVCTVVPWDGGIGLRVWKVQ